MWYTIMCQGIAGPYVAAGVHDKVTVKPFTRVLP